MDQNFRIIDKQKIRFLRPSWREQRSLSQPADASVEEQRKRIYFFWGIAITTPVLIGYGLFSWLYTEAHLDAILNITAAIILFTLAVFLKATRAGTILYQIGVGVTAFMVTYAVGFGLYGDSQLFWLLLYPIAVFYLFGIKEGKIWIAAVMLPSALLIYFPAPFGANIYFTNSRLMLPPAVMLSVIFSYLLESLRAHFYHQLEAQSIELRNALADVKELKGLLPICASCKSIRNDEGYWQSVEHYIVTRTNVTFSHGICNRCLKREDPEMYEQLLNAGKIKPVDIDA